MHGYGDILGPQNRGKRGLVTCHSGRRLSPRWMAAFFAKGPQASDDQDWRNRRTDVSSAFTHTCVGTLLNHYFCPKNLANLVTM